MVGQVIGASNQLQTKNLLILGLTNKMLPQVNVLGTITAANSSASSFDTSGSIFKDRYGLGLQKAKAV